MSVQAASKAFCGMSEEGQTVEKSIPCAGKTTGLS